MVIVAVESDIYLFLVLACNIRRFDEALERGKRGSNVARFNFAARYYDGKEIEEWIHDPSGVARISLGDTVLLMFTSGDQFIAKLVDHPGEADGIGYGMGPRGNAV